MSKKMEVLLLQPLVGKGNAGEVVEVKIHFANHYLFPNGIAMPYDKQAKNQRNAQMKRIEAAKAQLKDDVATMLSAIESAGGITFYKAATDTDGLYDSISESDIAEQIHIEHKVHLDKKYFSLAEKIVALGEYTVEFAFEDITAQFPIHVVKKEAVAV